MDAMTSCSMTLQGESLAESELLFAPPPEEPSRCQSSSPRGRLRSRAWSAQTRHHGSCELYAIKIMHKATYAGRLSEHAFLERDVMLVRRGVFERSSSSENAVRSSGNALETVSRESLQS